MNVLNYFVRLYQDKKQVALLSWAYAIIMTISVIVAGLIALFNQSLGVGALIIPLISLVAFCVNIVMWAMIRFGIESAVIRANEKRSAPFRKIGHEVTKIVDKSQKKRK